MMTAGRNVKTKSIDWNTPPRIIESVKEVFKGEIDLDPCSNEDSVVNARIEYTLPDNDGLQSSWDYKTIFVNPPYGIDSKRKTRIADWFRKAAEAHSQGSEVIMLVPVATNTGHWKKYVYPQATAICFLYDPRFKFWINGKEEPNGAPMSVAVIYFGKHFERFARSFKAHGVVIGLSEVFLPDTP